MNAITGLSLAREWCTVGVPCAVGSEASLENKLVVLVAIELVNVLGDVVNNDDIDITSSSMKRWKENRKGINGGNE